MKTIGILKNSIQEYAWGSYTAISQLLGKTVPSDKPEAELWMGAHPKAPSQVYYRNQWVSLLKLIETYPVDILGKETADKFSNKLPYLFKVLAAETPLSIQAHPNRIQARQGFEKENREKIPINAVNRNYKDNHHKPECICALTPFWALNGFRPINEILEHMGKICPNALEPEREHLRDHPDSQGLKRFFQSLMTMEPERKKAVVEMAIRHAEKMSSHAPAYQWMVKLSNEYEGDVGVFSPVLLNLVCLSPGQAMFLPAGELHAYLEGIGIELMANSDNVLRGGLTPKHIDVEALLEVLNFEGREIEILTPRMTGKAEGVYESFAAEFILSVITVKEGVAYTGPLDRSIEILLCIDGEAGILVAGEKDPITVSKGMSVVIPAAVETYGIKGNAVLYKASVPV